MRNLLQKEIKLSASILSFLFILFGLMFFIPGYPVLCGVFFVTLGIFQSFQNTRETNDILFSALLPIAKRDVVKAKYFFVVLIEACAMLLMTAAVILRMTVFKNTPAYTGNALMNANPFALSVAFFAFSLFNFIFVGGFFKTAYKYGRPFLTYIILFFITLTVAEALHYIPGCEFLNAFGTKHIFAQCALLSVGIVCFIIITFCSYKKSCNNFEKIDL